MLFARNALRDRRAETAETNLALPDAGPPANPQLRFSSIRSTVASVPWPCSQAPAAVAQPLCTSSYAALSRGPEPFLVDFHSQERTPSLVPVLCKQRET
ncbi:hypothetical protein C8T65DRAFT_222672 [Cerioporus squamosus]|nr:hypothetical protein C8T65DRAFT_222672 [Cerioporus squamosus]